MFFVKKDKVKIPFKIEYHYQEINIRLTKMLLCQQRIHNLIIETTIFTKSEEIFIIECLVKELDLKDLDQFQTYAYFKYST